MYVVNADFTNVLIECSIVNVWKYIGKGQDTDDSKNDSAFNLPSYTTEIDESIITVFPRTH